MRPQNHFAKGSRKLGPIITTENYSIYKTTPQKLFPKIIIFQNK